MNLVQIQAALSHKCFLEISFNLLFFLSLGVFSFFLTSLYLFLEHLYKPQHLLSSFKFHFLQLTLSLRYILLKCFILLVIHILSQLNQSLLMFHCEFLLCSFFMLSDQLEVFNINIFLSFLFFSTQLLKSFWLVLNLLETRLEFFLQLLQLV